MSVADIRVPALRGLMTVDGLSLEGRGDTLDFKAWTSSPRYAILNDTLKAALTGLRLPAPGLAVTLRSGPFTGRWGGGLPGWKEMRGDLEAVGTVPLRSEE